MKPSPAPCTGHQYSDGEHTYVVCIKCGAANPECNGCLHVWDEHGYCQLCEHYCYHKFPAGMTGAPCEICRYNPSVGPVPSAVPICPHNYGFEDISSNDAYHRCKGCWDTFSHHYDAEGHCEDCGHICNHGGATTGTCGYCGKNLETPTCYHGSYTYFNETYHKCDNCEDTFAHEWNDGHCNICDSDCPICNGDGVADEDGEGCAVCGKVACYIDHAQYCEDWTCTCGEPGKGEHHYVEGVCTDCNNPCPECGGNGAIGGCPNCHYE